MSAREEILALVERHETVSTTAIRAAVSVRWSAIPPLLTEMVGAGELVRVQAGVYAAARNAEQLRLVSTDGPAAQAILRALSRGAQTMQDLAAAAHGCVSGDAASTIVMRLIRQGFVGQKKGGYVITAKGAQRVPKTISATPPMTPYRTPAAPPRRPGSMDFLRAPSVFPTYGGPST